MRVLNVRNVHEALPFAINLLASEGLERQSRNGPVYLTPYPVTTVYQRPQERVIFWQERDANPFYHLYEALWMIQGRADVQPLTRYAKNAINYSDDGVTWHGAYGYRWRNQFNKDQLAIIVDNLKKNPEDRRSMLQMWDAEVDLGRNGKDLPCNTIASFQRDQNGKLDITVFCRSNDIIWGCLAADTPILSPEGNINIQQLAHKFQLGLTRYPVYSVDTKTGKTSFQWCTNVWQSGTKPILELGFDDGSSLKLTADHRLYKRKWKNAQDQTITEIRAGDLQIGDRIWAPRPYQKKDGRWYFKASLFNRGGRKIYKTAVEYAKFLHGKIPKNYVVHHRNEKQWDDRSENLEIKQKGKHQSDHLKENNPGFNKANREMLYEERTRRAEKGRRSRWNGLNQHKRQSQLMKRLQRENRINHKIVSIKFLDPEPVYDFSVENTHTALIGTGVLAHNCYGANAVQFSLLLEYMALWIGCEIGVYRQVSVNWHAYKEVFDTVRPLGKFVDEGAHLVNPYKPNTDDTHVFPAQMFHGDVADADFRIKSLMFDADTNFIHRKMYGDDEPFFNSARAMLRAHQEWRTRDAPDRFTSALDILWRADQRNDWIRAGREWIERRQKAWTVKHA